MSNLLLYFVKLLIRQQFPNVRSISTEELDQWLHDSTKPQPVLLDARTIQEFAMSHLKAAQRIDVDSVPEVSKETPIVVYCSVGYRSARAAQRLQQQGFSQVWNLEGSLFQWANEKRPLYQDDHLTQFVHPYNSRWGKLLKPQYRGSID